MRGKRFVSFVTVVLLCFGMVFGALSPVPVAAQADELSQRDFDELIESAQEVDPAFGPEDGELEHDPEIVTLAYAEQEVADFLATVTIANPFAGTDQQFDYGIHFRASDNGGDALFLRFIVLSTGVWAVTDATSEEVLARGEYEDLDVDRRGENDLILYAEGSLLHLGINGDYIGSAEVKIEDPGDVAVGTAFFGDSFQEGAVSEFTDFTVWELGGSSRTNNDDEPTPEDEDTGNTDNDNRGPLGPRTNDPTRDDAEETPEDEPTAEDEDEPTSTEADEPTPTEADEPTSEPEDEDQGNGGDAEGAVYESPTYGFILRYDDSTWEVSSENSSDGIDSIALSNGISTLTILGIPTQDAPADCVEVLTTSFLDSLEESGVASEGEVVDTGKIGRGPLKGAEFAEVTLTSEASNGGELAIAIYIACGPLGDSEYYVGVRHFVLADVYEAEAELRDDIVATLSVDGQPSSNTGGDEDQPSGNDDDDNGGGEGDSPNVARNSDGGGIYTSPTYGFTVEVLPGFSVEEDSVADGYDTLVIANDVARITVAGFASGNTAIGCVDSIVANLNADSSFLNVNVPVDEQGIPIRVDEAEFSAVPVYLTVTENGEQVVYGRLYACFSFDGGSSMLVYAYETPADVFIDEFDNIIGTLDLIQVP